MSGGTYNLTSPPNDRFFETLFHGWFIYSQSLCQKTAKEDAKNVRPEIILTFNRPTRTLYTRHLKPSEKGNTTLMCGRVHRSLFGGFYT